MTALLMGWGIAIVAIRTSETPADAAEAYKPSYGIELYPAPCINPFGGISLAPLSVPGTNSTFEIPTLEKSSKLK